MVWFQCWAGGGSELTQRLSTRPPSSPTGSAHNGPGSHSPARDKVFEVSSRCINLRKTCTHAMFWRLCKSQESVFLCPSSTLYLRQCLPTRSAALSPALCPVLHGRQAITVHLPSHDTTNKQPVSLGVIPTGPVSSLRPDRVLSTAFCSGLCPGPTAGSDPRTAVAFRPNTVIRNIREMINARSTDEWMLAS